MRAPSARAVDPRRRSRHDPRRPGAEVFRRRQGAAAPAPGGCAVIPMNAKTATASRAKDELADAVRVPAAAIRAFIAKALAAVGLPSADAAQVAELMVETDLAGADAHGVFRLPHYVRRLRAGGVNPRPSVRVTRSGPATALVDGDDGMGHLVMAQASQTAVELAREAGVGWVGTRNANHAGCAGIYAEIPMRAGMIGLMAAVANANHMPIRGGAGLLLGTNPVALGVPAGREAPVVPHSATRDGP